MSSVYLSNLSLKKEAFYSKEKKQQRVEELVEEILKLSQETNSIQGVCKELFRFSPKYKGKRRRFQFEVFYTNRTITSGILRSEDLSFAVGEKNAQKINELIIGSEREREDRTNPPCFLYPLLNGNRFEYIKFEKLSALDNDYFDVWEDQKKIYRTKIYPVCMTLLEEFLPEEATIIELCGGDGEFAQTVFDKVKTLKKYVLVDINKQSIDSVNLKDPRFFPYLADVVTCDFQQFLNEDKADLILGIGALTEQVFPSREAALKALQNATRFLKKGGIALFCGLTSSFLISEDFEKIGLTLLNCTSPQSFRPGDADPTFYIAIKTENVTPLWNFPSYEFTVLPPPKIIMPMLSH